MTSLDADRIRAAAQDWVWVPPDAQDVLTDEYRLTIYPGWATSVQSSVTTRPVTELAASVRARAEEAGSPLVRWWVTEATVPADTASTLRELGFRPAEKLDVLALDLTDPGALLGSLNVPADVHVTQATDAETIRDAALLAARIFDDYQPTPGQLRGELDQLTLPLDGALPVARRYVARWGAADGPLVGTGGFTRVGDSGRLWGAAVEEGVRGRGVYRALLAARCRDLAAHGTDFALVKARVDTSSPVLRRVGFQRFGGESAWELALG